jgi:SAM-dependent methyltransferase
MNTANRLEDLYRNSAAKVRARGLSAEEARREYTGYVQFVSTASPGRQRLLDVGCGNGWSAYFFSEVGWETTGLDLNASAFEPPTHAGLSLREGSVLELPFPPNSFDAVAANAMLEHVPDPRAALEEMLRVVRPGGLVCIIGPNLITPLLSLRGLLLYVWRNRPLRRLLIRDEGMPRHPGGNTIPELLIGLFHNLWRTIFRLTASPVHFEMRQPDLTPPLSADNDACYLCNPLDLVKFFRGRGCQVLRNGKPGRPSWTAAWAGGTWIVVSKQSNAVKTE